jgi:hypothetical protein
MNDNILFSDRKNIDIAIRNRNLSTVKIYFCITLQSKPPSSKAFLEDRTSSTFTP